MKFNFTREYMIDKLSFSMASWWKRLIYTILFSGLIFSILPLVTHAADIYSYSTIHWNIPMNGNLNDISGNGNNFIPSSLTYGSNYAIFSGSGSHGTGNSLSFASTTYTVNMWVNASSFGGGCPNLPIDQVSTLGHASFICLDASHIAFDSLGQYSGTFSHTFNTGSWYMITMADDNSLVYGYVNGVLVGTTTAQSSKDLGIGSASAIGDNSTFNGANSWVGNLSNYGDWYQSLSASDILSLYNCGQGAMSCNAAVPTPMLNFNYPVNGTTTAVFDNYWIGASNLNPTDGYALEVTSTENTIVGGVSNFQRLGFTGQILMHNGALVPFVSDNTCASFFTSDYNFTTHAQLDDLTTGQLDVAAATTTFNQLPICGNNATTTYITVAPTVNTSTINTATSSINNPFNVSTIFSNPYSQLSVNVDASTTVCSKPSSISDFGGGIAYAGCVLFVMPTSSLAYGYFQNAVQSFRNIFPFSVYFNVVGGAESAISSGTYSNTDTLPLRVLGLNGYVDLGDLTSSTDIDVMTTPAINTAIASVAPCNNACATEKVNNMFNIFIMIIWLTAGLKIVSMIVNTFR